MKAGDWNKFKDRHLTRSDSLELTNTRSTATDTNLPQDGCERIHHLPVKCTEVRIFKLIHKN